VHAVAVGCGGCERVSTLLNPSTEPLLAEPLTVPAAVHMTTSVARMAAMIATFVAPMPVVLVGAVALMLVVFAERSPGLVMPVLEQSAMG
jgi:hypothetical protein